MLHPQKIYHRCCDAQNDAIVEAGDTFSKAHHFSYPCSMLSLEQQYPKWYFNGDETHGTISKTSRTNHIQGNKGYLPIIGIPTVDGSEIRPTTWDVKKNL